MIFSAFFEDQTDTKIKYMFAKCRMVCKEIQIITVV